MTGDGILFVVLVWGIVAYTVTVLVQLGLEFWNARTRRTGGDSCPWYPLGTGGYRNDMECPACKEISLRYVGVVTGDNTITEYECTECGHYETGEW